MLQNYWGHRIENFAGADSAWCAETDKLYGDAYHPHLVSRQYLAGLSDSRYNESVSDRIN